MSKFYVTCSWEQTPHLSKAAIDDMMASLPSHQRDARSKGIPALGSGAIYPVPESDIICAPFEIPVYWRRAYGLDVGWNRTACAWGAYDEQSDTVYIYSEHYRGHAEPSVHADAIRARGDLKGVIDPASRGRSQNDGQQLMHNYQELGLKISPAQNGVESGIFDVYQRLSTGRLKIFSTMQNLLAEYRIYRRDDKGRVVKEQDHLMDALRYLIVSGINIADFPPEYRQGLQVTNGQHTNNYNPLDRKYVKQDVQTGMSQHKFEYNPLSGR